MSHSHPMRSEEMKSLLLDCVLRLRPTQQERILELVELYQGAADDQEASEIGEVLAEVLFRDPEALAATAISYE